MSLGSSPRARALARKRKGLAARAVLLSAAPQTAIPASCYPALGLPEPWAPSFSVGLPSGPVGCECCEWGKLLQQKGQATCLALPGSAGCALWNRGHVGVSPHGRGGNTVRSSVSREQALGSPHRRVKGGAAQPSSLPWSDGKGRPLLGHLARSLHGRGAEVPGRGAVVVELQDSAGPEASSAVGGSGWLQARGTPGSAQHSTAIAPGGSVPVSLCSSGGRGASTCSRSCSRTLLMGALPSTGAWTR